ncbi:MAG TPA: glycosyltransferase [Oligoflexia bacterium]|nr:glycosyltransferase [Oligoflexia bacterium]
MKIGIIVPNSGAYSQTFVRLHIERLPGTTEVLNARNLPRYRKAGTLSDEPRGFSAEILHGLRRLGSKGDCWLREQRLVRLIKRQCLDVVLAEFGPCAVRAMRSCAKAHTPLVVHFHGYDAHRTTTVKEGDGLHYPELFHRASALVCVSKLMEQRLLELGAPAGKLHIIPCGIDLSAISPTDAAANPPHFAAVGRFVEKKAPYLTLAAFRKVLDSVPEARLTMFGDGPLFETTVNLAHALGCFEQVSFMGACPHETVIRELQKARVFVQHSIQPHFGEDAGDCEGTPVAVLEASASGIPVVATAHAGINEAVLSGETGYLVAERDIDQMAAKMIRLAQDAQLAKKLGQAGRARMEALYSAEQSIGKLAEVLQHACRNSK